MCEPIFTAVMAVAGAVHADSQASKQKKALRKAQKQEAEQIYRANSGYYLKKQKLIAVN